MNIRKVDLNSFQDHKIWGTWIWVQAVWYETKLKFVAKI